VTTDPPGFVRSAATVVGAVPLAGGVKVQSSVPFTV